MARFYMYRALRAAFRGASQGRASVRPSDTSARDRPAQTTRAARAVEFRVAAQLLVGQPGKV
jgi:hypothetical protein